MRDTMSTPLPGEDATMRRTARVGYCCALAGIPAANDAAHSNTTNERRMMNDEWLTGLLSVE